MNSYTVKVPLAGFALICVDADDTEHAKMLALEIAGTIEVNTETFIHNDIQEVEIIPYETICQGNFFNASCNSIQVTEE